MSYDPAKVGCLCDSCPLRGQVVVPPEGPDDAEFVIVGEAPGFHEIKKRRPFVGPSGNQLNDILYYAGIDRRHCWISNTILCRPDVPGVEGKARFDMTHYAAWVRAENARVRKESKMRGEEFKPIPSPVECCAPRLWAELGHFERVASQRGRSNGAVVVPLGNFALAAISGKRGIMKYRGSVIPLDMNNPYGDA